MLASAFSRARACAFSSLRGAYHAIHAINRTEAVIHWTTTGSKLLDKRRSLVPCVNQAATTLNMGKHPIHKSSRSGTMTPHKRTMRFRCKHCWFAGIFVNITI